MYALGAQKAATFVADLQRCRHPQAEPVILSTGELVACVCIGCYQQLSASYIKDQADDAHRLAYCSHRGSRFSRSTCSECGRPVPKGTFPNIRPAGISDSEWLAFHSEEGMNQ